MKKSELAKLRKDCADYLKRVVANGGKLTKYHCGHCDTDIDTERPTKKSCGSKGYWDSLTICTNCGKMNFVATYTTGKTMVKAMR